MRARQSVALGALRIGMRAYLRGGRTPQSRLTGQSTTGPDQASSAALSSQNTAGGQKRQCVLRPRIRPHPKTPYPQSRTNDRKPIPLVAALRAAPPILAGVASNAVTSAMRCRARQRDKRNELHWLVQSTAPRPAPPRNPAPTAQWQHVPRARNVQQVLKWHPPHGAGRIARNRHNHRRARPRSAVRPAQPQRRIRPP